MNKQEVNSWLKKNWSTFTSYIEVSKALKKQFGVNLKPDSIRREVIYNLDLPPLNRKKETSISEDFTTLSEKRLTKTENKKYVQALDEIARLQSSLSVALVLKEKPRTFPIAIKKRGGSGEATAVALASDWHIEEEVKPEASSGMNFYNLEESKRRAENYFKLILYLINLEKKNTNIKHLVLGLLGDFISGDIHEDIVRSCLLQPTQAIRRCQDYIVSGIEFILQNSDLDITCVCHSGNHGRKDKQQLIANEAGSSLEYLMYHTIKLYFRGEKRVQVLIPEGYHSYLDIYDTTIRFHHGHAIRYGGGIGGITIPVLKKIGAWDTAGDARDAPFFELIKNTVEEWNLARPADIDCFGHFHQFLDGENFVANGSMIGYSPFGIHVGGKYQKPIQALLFVHSKHGHYDTRRIYFPI